MFDSKPDNVLRDSITEMITIPAIATEISIWLPVWPIRNSGKLASWRQGPVLPRLPTLTNPSVHSKQRIFKESKA